MAAEEKDTGTAQAIIVHSNKYLEKVCVALIKKMISRNKKEKLSYGLGVFFVPPYFYLISIVRLEYSGALCVNNVVL